MFGPSGAWRWRLCSSTSARRRDRSLWYCSSERRSATSSLSISPPSDSVGAPQQLDRVRGLDVALGNRRDLLSGHRAIAREVLRLGAVDLARDGARDLARGRGVFFLHAVGPVVT